MHGFRTIIGACAIAFVIASPLQADDPCDGLEAKVKHFLLTAGGPAGEFWSDNEAATVKRFRHNAGDGILVKWNFGAAGRVECAFLAYRTAGEQYHMFRVPTRHIDVQDIDGDGVDELVLLDGLSWGMDCSSAMATLPFGLRIAHLKAPSGGLIDVTRNYGGYVAVFLKNLKGHFNDYVVAEGGKVTTACEDAWVALLKHTYEIAWFRLLIAASAISIVTFVMGFSKSRHWRWTARIVGTIVVVSSVGAAFYSLGTVGWHCVGFCDAWAALQLVTGFHVHSVLLDVVSLVLTTYGGGRLLLS